MGDRIKRQKDHETVKLEDFRKKKTFKVILRDFNEKYTFNISLYFC